MNEPDANVISEQPGTEGGAAPGRRTDVNPAAEGGPESAENCAAAEPLPAMAEWTVEKIEALREQAAKAEDHWDRYVRTVADFENFKKRAARERQEAVRFAHEGLMARLLPVLDNFDMAMAALENPQGASFESLKTGVAMIHSQLKGVLLEAGLEEIEATGQPFDPALHEAVAQETSTQVGEDHVLRQTRKGYRLRERLLRPASVVVARPPAA